MVEVLFNECSLVADVLDAGTDIIIADEDAGIIALVSWFYFSLLFIRLLDACGFMSLLPLCVLQSLVEQLWPFVPHLFIWGILESYQHSQSGCNEMLVPCCLQLISSHSLNCSPEQKNLLKDVFFRLASEKYQCLKNVLSSMQNG